MDFGWVYDNFVALLTAATAFSFILSTSLYISSHRSGGLLAAGGDTGHAVYDYFIGRELNPRIGCSFDLKQWCELTPGLIGWAVLDWSMAAKQARQHGAVSLPMLLVCCFQTLYVVDSVWFERAILTTMDISSDGFGFMLVFGDLVWVPFTYCLQARYLVDHSPVSACAALLSGCSACLSACSLHLNCSAMHCTARSAVFMQAGCTCKLSSAAHAAKAPTFASEA